MSIRPASASCAKCICQSHQHNSPYPISTLPSFSLQLPTPTPLLSLSLSLLLSLSPAFAAMAKYSATSLSPPHTPLCIAVLPTMCVCACACVAIFVYVCVVADSICHLPMFDARHSPLAPRPSSLACPVTMSTVQRFKSTAHPCCTTPLPHCSPALPSDPSVRHKYMLWIPGMWSMCRRQNLWP